MAMLFIAVPSFMCVNCLLVHEKHSTPALNMHLTYFFDVVCTQVHCLQKIIMKTFSKHCLNIAVDVIRLYPCIKCGEC